MRTRFFLAAMLALSGAAVLAQSSAQVELRARGREALAAFDNLTNGFSPQPEHDAAMESFNEHETAPEGLGPLYNADSCGSCHFNPVPGGISPVTELRIGHRDHTGAFVDGPGGSLINSNGLPGVPMPYVPSEERVRSFRTALGVLGDGYVEAIADETLEEIARSQPNQSGGRIAGMVIRVPLLEAPGTMRVGRFGWKNQHASLLSFSGDAYLNEMGITTPLFLEERTSMGRSVAEWDKGPVPNDDGEDLNVFARFMRGTKAPPRDFAGAATQEAQQGSRIFDRLGCAICHVRDIVTAPTGTPINGATMTVPESLGNKTIHPFSDFLLHDVGTGDGIVQNGGPETANKLRTPPLWGLRFRNRMMHDGESLAIEDVIRRHRGEAENVTDEYQRLNPREKRALVEFLRTL